MTSLFSRSDASLLSRRVTALLVVSLVVLGIGLCPGPAGADEVATHAQRMEDIRRQIMDARSYVPMHATLNGILARTQAGIQRHEDALQNLRRQRAENEAQCAADSDCSGILSSIWSMLTTSYSLYAKRKAELDSQIAREQVAITELKAVAITDNAAKLNEYGITQFDELSNTVADYKSKADQCWSLRKQLEAYCSSPAVKELNERCFYLPQTSVGWTEEKKRFAEAWCHKSYCTPHMWPRCD